jgi:thymidylate kinase
MNIVVVDRSCSSSLICDISAKEADFRNCNSACAFEVRDESEHLLLIVNYQYYVQ